ncbi:ribosomal protein L25, Ctc-form [Treponema primitia ZAS-2]|uniref:Large ribosomal subunit protein bL25 n=1 Tax=Treponema primitia (strain ATCC BAA-887 / DSM 12427 / ZAS-2) TaxID=545694 RepID=F5YGS3_TREPZ|nr:50S ribosomal protein L25 [Treponema primitia]AEF86360.1 ribosomal protein L25, Ctc-form [Treponema primitia ZAS-2]
MSQVVFAARNRAESGSAEARRTRKEGRIPAVVYGRTGKALSIDLDALEFINSVRGISESTIVTINVDGQAHEAFVKDTQRNITDGQILHVDFYEVERGVSLRAKVSVHVHGNPVGVREGGILESPLHDIEVECLPKDLPERIDVDIAELKVNQSIHVRDLKLGEGVRLISNPDQVVALVKFAKAETETAAEGEAAVAETAEVKDTKEPAKDAKA